MQDVVVAQAVGVLRVVPVVLPLAQRRIKAIQSTAKGANPEHTPLAFVQGSNGINAQAIAVFRIIPVYRELVPIESIQPVLGANPEESSAVLQKDLGHALRQSLFQGVMVKHGEGPLEVQGVLRWAWLVKRGWRLVRRADRSSGKGDSVW